mmetsp:Transcript_39597/g.93184  ORF Transcript_39597/g.93184 Transcript_39597/m.93184 type:complete len:293 (-) Transcript_39597:95-973(-)
MPPHFTKTEKGVYILVGYFAPLAGSLLGIAFMAMHGSKFGPHAVPVKVENTNHNVLMDGPPESILLAFWLLTCFQVCMLIMNLVGPCSCENRLHFPAQLLGVGSDIAYLALANHSIQFWPKNAQVHDPLVYFNVSAVLMLLGQLVLAWGAFRLSGSGCRPPRGELSASELDEKRRRRQHFLPVFYSTPPPDRARVRCDYIEAGSDEEEESDADVLDAEADEILALYPHTVTSELLHNGEYALESAATGPSKWDACADHDVDLDSDEYEEDDHVRSRLVVSQQLPIEAGSRRR